MFVHELSDFEELIRKISSDKSIEPYLVEKDYWIMHALWGLQQQGYDFELKGGTSLSKGYKIIDRFSEDIDVKIIAPNQEIPIGKNHDRKSQISKREKYFDGLSKEIKIPGMTVRRDKEFDDEKFRSAGIRLEYQTHFSVLNGVKDGVLLEVGFDTTTPNQPIDFDSWAYIEAINVESNLTDNRAKAIKCYLPEFTFVEKLQAITRKVRQQKESGEFQTNFLRHFYDIHRLYQVHSVRSFIGTEPYINHKKDRFAGADNPDLNANLAFNLDSDHTLFEQYKRKFQGIENLFISDVPSFDEIYASIKEIKQIG